MGLSTHPRFNPKKLSIGSIYIHLTQYLIEECKDFKLSRKYFTCKLYQMMKQGTYGVTENYEPRIEESEEMA